MPQKFFIIILIILNLVGVIGLSIPETQAYLLPFTPFNLCLTLLFVFFNQTNINKNFGYLCLFVFSLGLLVEVLGVQTGLIFGNYEYGNTLGWKVTGVPPMIGINWLLCILSVGSFLEYLKINKWFKVFLGASLLVALDFLIEPVAIKLDFWHWQNDIIPLQNYIAWWVISAIMLTAYYTLHFEKNNKIATIQLAIFFLFFGILNLLLS